MKFIDYFRVGLATTYNIIVNALSLGRYLWLEGRVRNDVFRNWAGRFRHRPKQFIQPNSEKEIVELTQSRTGFDRKISELQTELEELLHLIEEKIRALFGTNISILAK